MLQKGRGAQVLALPIPFGDDGFPLALTLEGGPPYPVSAGNVRSVCRACAGFDCSVSVDS